MRRIKYLNAVLTANALLLSALVADRLLGGDQGGIGGALSPAPASAQPETDSGGGMLSGAEQRKQQLSEMRKMNSHLEKIEARLNAGLSVKVTEMPELKLPKEPAKP
jgi:hypothetical protein